MVPIDRPPASRQRHRAAERAALIGDAIAASARRRLWTSRGTRAAAGRGMLLAVHRPAPRPRADGATPAAARGGRPVPARARAAGSSTRAVHVGVLGGPRDSVRRCGPRTCPALDAALRTDVVVRAARGQPRRVAHGVAGPSGHPGAARPRPAAGSRRRTTAFGDARARPLDGCSCVTRAGWRDVRTGESRVWTRLRLLSRRSVPGVHGLVGVHVLAVLVQRAAQRVEPVAVVVGEPRSRTGRRTTRRRSARRGSAAR